MPMEHCGQTFAHVRVAHGHWGRRPQVHFCPKPPNFSERPCYLYLK